MIIQTPQAIENGDLGDNFNNFCVSGPILDLNIQKVAHDLGLSTGQLILAP